MKGNKLRLFAQIAMMVCGLWIAAASFVVPYRGLFDGTQTSRNLPFPLSVNASFSGSASLKTSRNSILLSDSQPVPVMSPTPALPKASSHPVANVTAPVYTPQSTPAPTATPEATFEPEETEVEQEPFIFGADVEAGRWHYEDDSMQIRIDRRSGGAEWGIFTAYVADVRLSDMDAMHALLANASGGSAEQRAETMSASANAVLAINGDFYNFRSDGIIVRNGEVLREKPAREMLAVYRDGNMSVGHEREFDLQNKLEEGLLHTYSFGPALIANGEMPEKYVSAVSKSNPRTAIGMVEPGHFIFVVVDGRQEGYSNGMSIRELGTFMYNLGCVEAYNLDGGASSEMCFMGETINRPSNGGRETSDILCITSLHDLGL